MNISRESFVSFLDVDLKSAFCIPRFPFAFEFECEWLNGNLAVPKSFELPFGYLHSKI